MNRCTGCRDLTEILLKMTINIQSIGEGEVHVAFNQLIRSEFYGKEIMNIHQGITCSD